MSSQAIFGMIDRNHNGIIEVDELNGLLSKGARFSTEEGEHIIRFYDKSDKGGLNFGLSRCSILPMKINRVVVDEFIDMIRSNVIISSRLVCSYRVIFITGGPGRHVCRNL
jgi:hypothetical protein